MLGAGFVWIPKENVTLALRMHTTHFLAVLERYLYPPPMSYNCELICCWWQKSIKFRARMSVGKLPQCIKICTVFLRFVPIYFMHISVKCVAIHIHLMKPHWKENAINCATQHADTDIKSEKRQYSTMIYKI